MVGRSIARRIRSGTLVGPGICRKWRPLRMVMTASALGLARWGEAMHYAWATRVDKASPWRESGEDDRSNGRARLMAVALKRRRLDAAACDPALARRLEREIEGEVLLDRFDRGRYSTDASIYQVEPLAVVVPRTDADVRAALALAREFGVPVTARGGGTSQAGQTVGAGLILDYSKYLAEVIEFDPDARTVWAGPAVVLDRLNRFLKPHGLFFPLDIPTRCRASLRRMAANTACGPGSIRYGIMVDNLLAIDALMADGEPIRFGEVPGNLGSVATSTRYLELIHTARAIAEREADAIATAFPKVMRRVGGYNLDRVRASGHNMAQLLVGSEGTLALFRRLQLQLQPLPRHRVLGVCHFPTFHDA